MRFHFINYYFINLFHHFIKHWSFDPRKGLGGHLFPGINILGYIYNIDTPFCTSDWELFTFEWIFERALVLCCFAKMTFSARFFLRIGVIVHQNLQNNFYETFSPKNIFESFFVLKILSKNIIWGIQYYLE